MPTPHKGGPRLLVTDREGALYLERARIHVESGRIVYHITDDDQRREYNIPHVNLAVLFMGQGTSITQDAMRLLGEEGVHLAVTGTGGTPIHMGGLTTYSGTRHFRDMLPVYLDPRRSLQGAVAVMRDRTARMSTIGASGAKRYLRQRDADTLTRIGKTFNDRLAACPDIQTLLGYEGAFSKACYAEFSRMSGVAKDKPFSRNAGGDVKSGTHEADAWRVVNRLIDHGNYLCYGMAGAALWAVGIPPHMSIFHGKTRAGGLVFDIADSFKDALVLPLAFSMAKSDRGDDPEKVFRARLISAFDDRKILSEAIATVENLISAGHAVSPKGAADA
jgi:CRISPR-associated protein Cas1|tara:strand:- start:43531 stop:44529 length:999 start_codon:yes stop_codon:yes gene_type:complete